MAEENDLDVIDDLSDDDEDIDLDNLDFDEDEIEDETELAVAGGAPENDNAQEVNADDAQKAQFTKNDGTFTYRKKVLYRYGQKYTGEFGGKLYFRGALYTGDIGNVYYEDGVKFTGIKEEFRKTGNHKSEYGEYLYVKGVLAEGVIAGKMYHEGTPLTGLAAQPQNNGDENNPDAANTVLTYYKNGVKGTGKCNGLFYANGKLFTGIYKNGTYLNGVKQRYK